MWWTTHPKQIKNYLNVVDLSQIKNDLNVVDQSGFGLKNLRRQHTSACVGYIEHLKALCKVTHASLCCR